MADTRLPRPALSVCYTPPNRFRDRHWWAAGLWPCRPFGVYVPEEARILLKWVCADCPEEWLEAGDANGYGKALAHTSHTSRQGAKHTIRGLVETDDGEVKVAGLNKPAAQRLGLIRPDPTPTGKKAPPKARGAEEKGQIRQGSRDAMEPSAVVTSKGGQVLGTVKGETIEFPVYMTAYWSMGMRVFRDPDTDEPYPATAEGMSKYVVDVMKLTHETLLWKMIGLNADQARSEAGRQQMQAITRTIRGLTSAEIATMAQDNLNALDDMEVG